MKLKLTPSVVACALFSLLVLQPVSSEAVALPVKKIKTEKEKKAKTNRVSSSRNNSSVKIYPDPLRRIMHVVAKENEGKEIDFFVFDLEGTLVKHFKMINKDHERLSGLERGKYVYNVFAGDEETAAGEFEIR
jgi:hypothetical protein